MEYVDISKIVKATINFFQIRHGYIEYKIQMDPDVTDLHCYKAEFAMIIYNLIFNAITAIYEAGRSDGLITIRVMRVKGNNVILIEDNGAGIKHEHDEKIYEPQFSTKKKGTGLGLYYIRKTLESYNGTIAHSSVVNKGTAFTLTIPAGK